MPDPLQYWGEDAETLFEEVPPEHASPGGYLQSDNPFPPNDDVWNWNGEGDESALAQSDSDLLMAVVMESGPVNAPPQPPPDVEWDDQGEMLYEEPTLDTYEWSNPINPNAPPQPPEDAYEPSHADTLAYEDDWFIVQMDDFGIVSPDLPQVLQNNSDDPAAVFEDLPEDDWFIVQMDDMDVVVPNAVPGAIDEGIPFELYEEPYYEPTPYSGGYQQSDNPALQLIPIEDAWHWDDELPDEADLQFVEPPVGPTFLPQPPEPDLTLELEDPPEDDFFDHFSNQDLDPQQYEDPWEWQITEVDEDTPIAFDTDPVGPNAPPQPVEDGWDWVTTDHDLGESDWQTLGETDPVGPDSNPLLAPEDAWDWATPEVDLSESDWQLLRDDDDNAVAVDNNPLLAPEDAHDWQSFEPEDDSHAALDTDPVGPDTPPQPPEDAFFEDAPDEDAEFATDVVGPNYVSPIAQPPEELIAEDEFLDDYDTTLDSQAVGADNFAPTFALPEDGWLLDDELADELDFATDAVPDAPAPSPDDWAFDEEPPEEADFATDPVADAPPVASDDWLFDDEVADESDFATDALPAFAQQPAPDEWPFEDEFAEDSGDFATDALAVLDAATDEPWLWDDELPEEVDFGSDPVSTDTLSGFDDVWDWSADWQEILGDVDSGEIVADVIGPDAPPLPCTDETWDLWGTDIDDDSWLSVEVAPVGLSPLVVSAFRIVLAQDLHRIALVQDFTRIVLGANSSVTIVLAAFPPVQSSQLAGSNEPYEVDVSGVAVFAWQPNIEIAPFVLMRPTGPNQTGFIYQNGATAGQTGSTEPTWARVSGATVPDGSVTWTTLVPPVGSEDSIASVTWTQVGPPDGALTISTPTNGAVTSLAYIGGGTSGQTYQVLVTITMTSTAVHKQQIYVTIL